MDDLLSNITAEWLTSHLDNGRTVSHFSIDTTDL
jgi:hypothetical protein